MASSSTVLIIGCGVAGPVIGLLLKHKGYHPIIFERAPAPGDVGASLMLFPNGLKVLTRLDAQRTVPAQLLAASDPLQALVERTGAGALLGAVDLPREFAARYGAPAAGARRTEITAWLRALALREGVEVRDGWALERIEEEDDAAGAGSVTAFFSRGGEAAEVAVTGAFLVGCDGIKSTARRELLARRGVADGAPTFTGLTQINGFSPTPAAWRGEPAARNWYGGGLHALSYPIARDMVSWAVTVDEDAGDEAAWGLYEGARRARVQAALAARLAAQDWDPVFLALVSSASRMIKYGIYDRPHLPVEQWYSGRCVLVGDAVHPTSVHLGQGANQACEDCYHLADLLPDYDSASALSAQQLTTAFQGYAEKQQPRTSTLVEGARRQGRLRVVPADKSAERDEVVRKRMADRDGLLATYDFMYSQPF